MNENFHVAMSEKMQHNWEDSPTLSHCEASKGLHRMEIFFKDTEGGVIQKVFNSVFRGERHWILWI